MIQALLEQGIINRLQEMLALSQHEELALLAICAVMKSPVLLHRRLLLMKFKNPSFMTIILKYLKDTPHGNSKKELIAALSNLLYLDEKFSLELLESDFVGLCVDFFPACPYDIKVETGFLLCQSLEFAGYCLKDKELAWKVRPTE